MNDFEKTWAQIGQKVTSMEAELAVLRRWKETADQYPDLPVVLSPKDVAKAAGISMTKAYDVMRDGSMKIFYAGRAPRCPRKEFIRWMESGGSGGRRRK